MTHYIHTLTETEIICGVTLEDVADVLPKCLIRDGSKIILPAYTGPALAMSVARAAFGGAEVEFRGLNGLSQPVYAAID